MSLSFWFNLLLALLVFVCALLFINRSKIHFIQRLRAARLRNKIVPKMQSILPMLMPSQPLQENELFALFRLKADLELLSTRTSLLYEVEQRALAGFLAKLSSYIAKTESPVLDTGVLQEELEELLLAGQRVIVEVTELSSNRS